MSHDTETTLVTGFPSFAARRMTRKILESDPGARLYLLARSKFRIAAEEFLEGLAELSARDRVVVLEGDVCDMDLGLAGGEYRAIADEVTSIHHYATVYYLGAPVEQTQRVNVDGTRAMLDLAAECTRLRRFTYLSTAQVSGSRSGVVLEEELDEGQRFRNAFEETKFRAERLVQEASRRLPITILRPAQIVGDSQTGEIDRFDGPYYLIVLIATAPVDVHLPLPGRGSAPLNLVPIDFVIDAAWALSRDPRAVGRTFHLTDPAPLSSRTVYELVARHAERKPPRGIIPTALARAVLRTPGLERLARAPLAFLESFNQMTVYNCRNTLALLDGSGVRCPPFDSYVDCLVRYVREVHESRQQQHEEEQPDPFE